MKLKFLLLIVCGVSLFSSCKQEVAQKRKPNILFISIDDLRPEMSSYDNSMAITPNIDKLSKQGTQFNRAYCQQAICSPSRASLMTGARPETINVIENYTYFRDENPDIITLPQHFKDHGYTTINCGKVYHAKYNDPGLSWSMKPDKSLIKNTLKGLVGGYIDPKNQEIFKKNKSAMIKKYGDKAKYGLGLGPAFECMDVPDNQYIDGYVTDLAIANIKKIVEEDPEKPFFMGLGYIAPHLNFIAPKKYWDLYDRNDIELAENNTAPENGAAMGLHASFELRTRANIPNKGDIPDSLALELKHAYLATSSYVDAQIGKVLDFLKEEGLLENTIVMVWSDHGYHLGEMGIWGKATNYEIATRVPLVVWSPFQNDKTRGQSSNALVELVDMYPTLCDMAGLPKPEHLEGTSFTPLLGQPNLPWKEAVFSQFPTPALREWAANPLSEGMRETYFGPLIEEVEQEIKDQMKEEWDRALFENDIMGYSMRTNDYRMIVWKNRKAPNEAPIFIELFDHKNDPKETKNIADERPELVQQLMLQFDKGWKGNVPQQQS
ncbi:sulfatase-like hydrolase/transferase [Flammeovirga yaeyamensis]|uniref:Sulfatase-like hydrolase/transferase n=1 Tax=Flammeovirga yaeyamensis TaxID=367791 RepID=A0AAX1NB18_9BACT|nr:sulfatase [Flammeovirga yaeyamensis]MBB3699925.1 arylsulfatase A-like enzyme [Flammeovirga yaeyamensis]NMF37636.1 sulfatase [Flammeovirga yaeyamensis]QWG04692.1 sulfatase-like hydrolase/transferase [Flammeovirga yaeyamensis]